MVSQLTDALKSITTEQAKQSKQTAKTMESVNKSLKTLTLDRKDDQVAKAIERLSGTMADIVKTQALTINAVSRVDGSVDKLAGAMKEISKPRKKTINIGRGEDYLMQTLTVTEH